ncbi:SusC/RagA family TonB-linked outer membrane protein [Pedobacter immunditicola]|uniref:SusC/RagA family TonB-linked outer membrane protein n=1 Tax=Pedobacter immunditicola TaxID=3133440 RepID=UPI00309CEF7F
MNLKFLHKFQLILLLMLLVSSIIYAQERKLTGKVVDAADGQPLPGVNVSIKGLPSNVSTNADGIFTIKVNAATDVIVFSYIGFVRQNIISGTQSNLTVRLVSEDNGLDEVVVVGYGTQKKSTLTGSVVSIKTSEIEDLPVSNLGTAIAGRLLGVGVSGGTSRPGSGTKISVRSPNPFLGKDGGSTEPLYVIDEVIQITPSGQPDATLFNSLDASEVESISVLKDGAAAIYGARSANGVILVTTKRGKEGKPRISYSGSYAVNDEAYRPKMMSAYQFGQYFNIMNGPNGSNAAEGVDNFFTADELEHFKGIDYNWLDDAWSSASNMRHNINVSGGAAKATYFANVSYYTQEGNLGALDFNRWNFRAGSDVNVATNLKVGIQVSGNYSDVARTFNKIGNEGLENDYINLLTTPRYIPAYVNGNAVKLPGTETLSGYHFYEIERLGNVAENNDRTFTVNLNAEYSIPFVKGLKARATYATNLSNGAGSQLGTVYQLYDFQRLGTNKHIYDDATNPVGRNYKNGDRLYYSNINQKMTQTNLILNYNRSFGKHTISGLATVEKAEAESMQADVWKESPLLSTNGQFNTAFGVVDGKTAGSETGSLGYIGRANYSYDNKYLAEFLFRSDASTKFAPENYWGKFYSGSLGWVISEESFFKVKAVDFLKLRYSFGLLGADQLKPWLWRQRYSFQDGKGAVFGGNSNTTTGMKMEASPNRDATWGSEIKNNLGLDAQFLNSRLSTTIEAYYNHGYDILIERTGNVPITVGGSVAPENYGEANFFGYEIALGWNDKIGKDARYGIDLRFGWGDNKVVKMNYNDNDMMYPWNPKYGESSDIGMWGMDYMGMFKTQDEVTAYVNQYGIKEVFGTPAAQLKPGMLYYRDVRGELNADGAFGAPDGIINNNDQVQLSKKKDNPYGFGITLKAGYKGFNVDAVLGGSFGGWSDIDARSKMNNNISRVYQSLPAIWGDIYDPAINPTGTMPNPNWSDISLKPASSFWGVNSFRMVMRNFNVNYTIPKKLIENLGISNARISFTGLNPITFYNPYSYRDPSTAYNAYPNLKTYSLGVNLTL